MGTQAPRGWGAGAEVRGERGEAPKAAPEEGAGGLGSGPTRPRGRGFRVRGERGPRPRAKSPHSWDPGCPSRVQKRCAIAAARIGHQAGRVTTGLPPARGAGVRGKGRLQRKVSR